VNSKGKVKLQSILLKEPILDVRCAEAIKALRTNVSFAGSDIRSIVVTSCLPGEGKSWVCFELATSFSETGRRVLYIDADLRRSALKSVYKGGRVSFGLTHYLVGMSTIEECVCKSNINNLHIIFAGPFPPNPSELLSSKAFEILIEAMRQQYDLVLIDSPPLGSVIDAAVLAEKCDGVVLVISSGCTSYRLAKRVKQQLDKTDTKILGAILNKADFRENPYYGNYYSRKENAHGDYK